ncbi:MAG: pesticin C-terminus-like muramidase, partial [Gloeotrichia echinulata HAB0833]
IQQSIAASEAEIEAKQQDLQIAEFRIQTLAQFQNWTQQTLTQLLSVEQLNLAQAKLEQEIALNRENAIDDEVKNRLERERLDIERDRQIALVTLQQLNQLQTEEVLQQAINDLRFDLGLNPIADIIRLAEWKGQLSGLLTNLNNFQAQPDIPANLKTLLIETSQEIQIAIQGKAATNIQDNLLTSANKLIQQANDLKTAVAQLEQEEQRYILLLQQSETDLQQATKTLYTEIQQAGILADEKEILTAENLEILYKIAYAQEAGQISQELAKQSQQILNQILEKRIETRAQRKKNYINDLVSTVTMVLAIAGAVFTGGATLGLYSATSSLVALGNALTFASNILSAAQAAYNGDWAKAIYSIAMTVVDYKITGIDNQIKGAEQSLKVAKDAKDLTKVAEATKILDDLNNVLHSLQTFKTVASTTYNTHRALESGDNVLAILSVFKGVADVAALGVNLDKTTDFSNFEKALITAGQVAVTAHESIKLIEDAKLLEAFEKLKGVTSTISGNFASELVSQDISSGLFTLKVALTVGEVSGDVYKTIKAIEDNKWKDALKSLQKIGKTIDKNFDKNPSPPNESGANPSGESRNDNSQSKLDALVEKFTIYKDKLEQYLKDKFDLDYAKIEQLADTANVLNDIFRDDNSQAWLTGIRDILKIWEGELKSVINENDKDKTFDVIKNLAETANLLYTANEKGKVNDWVSAIQNSAKLWQGVVYDSVYKPEVAKLAKDLNINPADIKVERDGSIYFSPENQLKILIGFEAFRLKADEIEQLMLYEQAEALDNLPDNLKTQVINYWLQKYPSAEAWMQAHPILLVDNGGNASNAVVSSQLKILQTLYYQVSQGQLTFNVEGQEGGKYHSRQPHWPGGKSGVTIGRGYDLGQHTKQQIIQDLKAAGLSDVEAQAYAELQGLKGENARNKLDELKDKLVEITPEQQQKLFNITWTKQYKDVQRISNKSDVVQAYGKVDFSKLDPAIRDLVVDLKYRGDYNLATRTKVQELMSKNDLEGLLNLMSDQAFWQKNKIKGTDGKEYNIDVPSDRFKQRIQFLEKAVSNQKAAEKSPRSLNYNIGDVDVLTGVGGQDVLTGYTNADLFILGNTQTTFYSQNNHDYALINNFDPNIDLIQLHGHRDNYVLGAISEPNISGVGIYWKIGTQEELIGVLPKLSITDVNLNSQVIYVTSKG